jgi:acyl transferase domain-containing protein
VTAIGVVGIGCRFPGAKGPEELWRMLARGEHAVRPLPPERLAARYYDPAPGTRGRSHVRAGALLDDVERFDHALLGIPPREAQFIDPMHRILLEVTWHALEDAGLDPRALAGSRTGVFVGSYAPDFTVLQTVGPRFPEDLAPQAGPNCLHSMASGRVAHTFDLAGPAITIDTACSSSLVALHLAVRSLRAGECDLALVGGVNLALSPDSWVNLSLARMASPDGRSKAFSSAADGYGRGEGCGVLVLERAADGVRRGARVRALVRGTAVNHDGRGSTMLAPSRSAQVAVARDALADAGVRAADVALVEAHGTGTPTGDPVELGALSEVYGTADRPGPVLVGSVKANINHLEAASGVAGVVKAVLALEHGSVPPHVLVGEPTTVLDLESSGLRLAADGDAWPEGPRLVGVNSFGLSGTNAHAVLEAAPVPPSVPSPPARHVLALSAATPDALRSLTHGWATAVEDGAHAVRDVVHTARVGRADLEHRVALVLEESVDASRAAQALRAAADGAGTLGTHRGRARPATSVVLAFPGQGSQRAGAGARLAAQSPVFSRLLEESVEAFEGLLDDRLGGCTLLDVLLGRSEAAARLIDRTDVTQPALFALQVALARLLEVEGVVADAVVGHSVGALAAAVVAGHLDPRAGAHVVAARGLLLEGTAPGGMIAVTGATEAVEDLVSRLPAGVDLAARNAPGVVTLTGTPDAIDGVGAMLDAAGLAHRRLPAQRAFHSAAMDPVLGELTEVADAQPRSPGRVGFASDLTGRIVPPGEELPVGYWARHARSAVRFEEAVRAAAGDGRCVVVEVGPGQTLGRLARRTLGEDRARAVVTLPEHPEGEGIEHLRAALYVEGVVPSVRAAASEAGGRVVTMPRYPFGGDALMSASVRANLEDLARRPDGDGRSASDHVALPGGGWAFGSAVDGEEAVLADHALFGAVVVPGAYWVATAMDAVRRLPESRSEDARRVVLTDVTFSHPLLPGGVVHDVTTALRPDGTGWSFQVCSRRRGDLHDVTHAVGRVDVVAAGSPTERLAVSSARSEGAGHEILRRADFYGQMRRRGLELGAAFQAVTEVTRRGDGAAEGTLVRPVRGGAATHPGLVDAYFQVIAAALPDEVTRRLGADGRVLVPVAVDRAEIDLAPLRGGPVEVSLAAVQDAVGRVRADVVVGDEARLLGVVLGEVSPAVLGLGERTSGLAHEVSWDPVESPEPPADEELRRVRVLGAGPVDDDLVSRLAEALELDGVHLLGSDAPEQEGTDLVVAFGTGPDATGPELVAAASAACERLVRVVRAAAHGTGRMWVVVRDADRDPVAAAVAAVARTVASEHHVVFGGVVDVAHGAGRATVRDALRSTVLARRPEPQVRVEEQRVLRPRLRAVPPAAAPRAVHGCWVVTGGSGAIAGHVAGWLLGRGASHVALLSRRGATTGQGTEAAHQPGTSHHRVDVGESAALAAVLDEVRARYGPVRGAVHAAGSLADGPLVEVGADALETVMAPKLAGAAAILEHVEADAEVLLCSSVAGTLGTPLQGAYAAANAGMDALARAARARGRDVTAVAWGPWSGGGMVDTGSSAAVVEGLGLRLLDPVAALAELDDLRTAGVAHRVVADAEWGVVDRAFGSAVVSGLVGTSVGSSVGTGTAVPGIALDEETALARLVEAVASATAVPAAAVDVDGPLASLGVDSITTIDLRAQIATTTGVELPVAVLLGGATLRGIAGHIVSGSRAPGAAGTSPIDPVRELEDPEQLLAGLEEMSDEEVAQVLALLDAELDEKVPDETDADPSARNSSTADEEAAR